MREDGRGARPRDVSNREECRLRVVKGTMTECLSLERNDVILLIRHAKVEKPYLFATESLLEVRVCIHKTAIDDLSSITLTRLDKLGISTLVRCRLSRLDLEVAVAALRLECRSNRTFSAFTHPFLGLESECSVVDVVMCEMEGTAVGAPYPRRTWGIN